MIDFRYHLVSLVSVFIALAVGIVLGAGPLRGQIADELSARVDQLSTERNQYRTERDVAEAGVKNRDTFTTQLVPTLVRDRLAGRRVVLISLPGADADAIDPLSQAVEDAGATITGQLTIEDAWWAADHAEARAALVAQWFPLLTVPAGSTAGTATPTASVSPSPAASGDAASAPPDSEVLAALLARALVTGAPTGAGEPDPTAGELLSALEDAGLVTVRGGLDGRAGLAVVLTPGVDLTRNGDPTPVAGDGTQAEQWAALALAVDRAGRGAVALGPASAALGGGVLAAVRDQNADQPRVSSVDTGGTPMGFVTTVYALQEQASGTGGAYGFGKGATAPLPPKALS
jgi:hypothetical protein